MPKVASVALVLVLVAAVGGASYWAGSRTAPAPEAKGPAPGAAPAKGPPPGIVVEAVKVATVKLPNALTAVGSLRSDETVILRPEVAGRVAQILFREGERVAKGDVLVRLDDSVQKADLDKARANLVLSKTKHERSLDLLQKGFLSSQAKDEAENSLKVAQADAELAEARLMKMAIRAPFSGTIGLRQVSIGDYVKEGQDIVNLEATDPLKVDFRVPETAMSLVRNGQTLQITLDAIPDKAFDGRVVAINPLIDANGRSIVIRAQVPNGQARLRPGLFARVRLFTSDVRDTLVIPEESIFPVGDDKFVYKVVDGRAMRQKVDIGLRREGKVEILGGLTTADTVVTDGIVKLRDGAPVRLADAPAAGQPAAKAAPASKGNS